jgi:hypothetical protein
MMDDTTNYIFSLPRGGLLSPFPLLVLIWQLWTPHVSNFIIYRKSLRVSGQGQVQPHT